MDSQVLVDGALLEVVDAAWRTDVLPSEEIDVPAIELPDTEPDSATPNLTSKQLENKWTDLMLGNLLEYQSLNMTNMEIPHIGSNCDFNSCNQLDFLPIVCDYCHKIFCKDHCLPDNHSCALKPKNIIPENHVSEKTKHSCSITTCQNSELTPIICTFCSHQFCLGHRHQVDHGCLAYKPPSNPRAEAAAKIEELSKTLCSSSKKVKKIKNDKLAAKVQLMKLKGKAVGNKELPYEEKIFFLVFLPKNEQHKVDNPLAVFVSHYWSVGRTLDAIADLAKIQNRNNEIHAPRLELFRVSDGTILRPLDLAVKELVKEEKLFNGQSLILEFVPRDTNHLEKYAEYDET